MLHQWNKLGFWPHHFLAYAIMAAWGVAIRGYAVARFQGDVIQASINSLLALGITWLIITTVFELVGAGYRSKLSLEARLVLAMAIGSAIGGFVVPTFNWMFGMMAAGLDVGTDRSDIMNFLATRYPRVAAGVLIVLAPFWLVANWGWYAHREATGVYSRLGQRQKPAPPPIEDAPSASIDTVTSMPPAFLRKLPPEKRGILWAITAEQHYLRIYTSAGDDLILMRFSDALDELSSVGGQQIHRSHWVSTEGFKAFSEDDKRLLVILQNDVALPVSRPNYTAARQTFAVAESETSNTDNTAEPIKTSSA